MDWAIHAKVRSAVERYYQAASKEDAIDIPKYDLFVTEIRKDWEQAGYDLSSEADLFKLWGALQVTLASCGFMLQECKSHDQVRGAIKVLGTYGNMTGLFLREVSKDTAPPIQTDA